MRYATMLIAGLALGAALVVKADIVTTPPKEPLVVNINDELVKTLQATVQAQQKELYEDDLIIEMLVQKVKQLQKSSNCV
jgi:hypothetical protein